MRQQLVNFSKLLAHLLILTVFELALGYTIYFEKVLRFSFIYRSRVVLMLSLQYLELTRSHLFICVDKLFENMNLFIPRLLQKELSVH